MSPGGNRAVTQNHYFWQMNRRIRLSWAAASALCLLAACNVNVNEGSGNPNGMPLDSGTTVTTHTESHTESHTDFEIKGGINSESHTTTHTVTTVGEQSLADRLAGWKLTIFPDYKDVEMDPMEAYPKYDHAQGTLFGRIRRRNPITNSHGDESYPRLLLKAYRFASPEALRGDVEPWLNTLGSTTKDLKLGQSATVKSPPLLCAVLQNDFLVVQAACIYEGEEWTATEALFFKTVEEQGAAYAFQVKCKTGALAYRIGGANP